MLRRLRNWEIPYKYAAWNNITHGDVIRKCFSFESIGTVQEMEYSRPWLVVTQPSRIVRYQRRKQSLTR